MTLSYQDTVRNTRMGALTTALGTTAYLEIFIGAPAGKSAGVFNADPAGKLASLACSNPVAPAASAGVLTFSGIASSTGITTGTPGSFRFKTAPSGSPSTVIIEGDAAVGSGSLNFGSNITSGGTVQVTSAVITEGNS